MEKKEARSHVLRNITFLVITILVFLMFVKEIAYAIDAVRHVGSIKSVKFSILQLSIYVSGIHNTTTYNIFNYPLIPMLAGLIYNIYIYIKICKDKSSF